MKSNLTPIMFLDDNETWGGPGFISFIDTDAVDADGGELPEYLRGIGFDLNWTEDNKHAAWEDGWSLTEDPYGYPKIERIDMPDGSPSPKFSSDQDALLYVFKKACETGLGASRYRRAILRMLFNSGTI